MSEFKECSVKHVHFIDLTIPDLLEVMMRELKLNKRGTFIIIDLGCGDGRLLYALHRKGLLRNAVRVVGVDISEERIQRLKECYLFAEGIVADATNLRISGQLLQCSNIKPGNRACPRRREDA